MRLGGFGFLYHNIFPGDEAARRDARDAKRDADILRDRIDRMALLTMAVWSLAAEKLGITEEELKARVQEIDLSDGKLDGKLSPEIGNCPKCRRQLSKRHRSCIYCGHVQQSLTP